MNSREEELREIHFIMAHKRVESIKGFYNHVFCYVSLNILLSVYWYFESFLPYSFWETTFYVMVFGAGTTLLLHALLVFMPKYFFASSWEEKQFKKLAGREKQQTAKYE